MVRGDMHAPPRQILWLRHTVTEWAVHILLECIIVLCKFLEDISHFFVWPLIPLVWTSGDVSLLLVSKQSGQPDSSLAEVYVLHVP